MYSAIRSYLQRCWGQAVCYREKARENAQEKKAVFSLDFITLTESLLTTVFGSELVSSSSEVFGVAWLRPAATVQSSGSWCGNSV